MNDQQERFEQQIRQTLDQSSAGLDGETLSRLRQARSQALAAARPRPARPNRWMPAAAMAGITTLAVGIWLQQPSQESPALLAGIEDIELLAAQEDIEFYEDLDFYLWLESQAQQG